MVLRIEAIQARLRRLEDVISELTAFSRLDRASVRASIRDQRDLGDFAQAIRKWLDS